MAPKSRRQKQATNAIQCRWSKKEDAVINPIKPIKVNPKNFVMSTLLEGSNYSKHSIGAAVMGVKPIPKSTFYYHQKNVLPVVFDISQENIDRNLQNAIASHAPLDLSIDGRYSSARNGSQMTLTAFDLKTGLVVAVENVIKSTRTRVGNYTGPSNMMESVGVERMAAKIRQKYGQDCIASITTDGDNKSQIAAQKAGLNFERNRDHNHGIKSMKKCLTKTASDFKKENGGANPFFGFQKKIINWADTIMYNVNEKQSRIEAWTNMPDHLIGKHDNCKHDKLPENHVDWERGKKDEKAYKCLQGFCQKTKDFISSCEPSHTTQQNESLNAVISTFAPKRIALRASYVPRTLLACAKHNDPYIYLQILESLYCTDSIAPELLDYLFIKETERVEYNAERHSKENRERKNSDRLKWQRNNKSKPGDYDEIKNDFNSMDN